MNREFRRRVPVRCPEIRDGKQCENNVWHAHMRVCDSCFERIWLSQAPVLIGEDTVRHMLELKRKRRSAG